MNYLNEITKERLKNGWLFELNNQHLINKGEDVKFKAIKAHYSSVLGQYVITYHGDLIEVSDGFTYVNSYFNSLKIFIKSAAILHDLELKSMKRKKQLKTSDHV